MLLILIYLSSSISYLPHEEKSFVSWMHSNNFIYTGDEYHFRFGIFLTNLRLVREHNKSNKKYKLGLNKFSAYTPSEYQSHIFIKKETLRNRKVPNTSFPDSFDWRDKGIVNPIRDQGYCNSDWAIFATFLAESSNGISTGKLLTYSVQNLIDCVDSCYGCDGGYLTDALNYIITTQNGKFNLESDYPYTGYGGDCKFDQYTQYGSLSDTFVVDINNNSVLASTIINYGPVGTSVNALDWTLAMYSGGIYEEHVCFSYEPRDVGVVGYGTEENIFYWIIRFSFGTVWGEEGYMRMHRSDLCALSKSVTVVIS